MDIITELNGMSFEWDKNKEKLNYKKYRISFDTAIKVFNDENRLEFYDEGHSTYEDRFITIGIVNDTAVLIQVVYTDRNNSVRIISARKATSYERGLYYDNQKNL